MRSRLFRSRLKSLTLLWQARSSCRRRATPRPLPRTPRDNPTDQFVIGERPFAASSSWNTPIAEGAIYQKVGWPIMARFGVAWSSYSPAIYAASKSDPVVSVQYPPGWGYPGGIVNIRMPPDADGAVGSDGELLVIDGDVVHNFWQFKRLSLSAATARSSAPRTSSPVTAGEAHLHFWALASSRPVQASSPACSFERRRSRRDRARSPDLHRHVSRKAWSHRPGDQRRRTQSKWLGPGGATPGHPAYRADAGRAIASRTEGFSRLSKIRSFRHRRGWRGDEPAGSGECV